MNLNEDRFTLTKVKREKNGGLDIHFDYIVKDGEETYNNKGELADDKIPHPDLMERIKKLKPFLVDAYGFNKYRKLISNAEFQGTEDQVTKTEDLNAEILGKVDITGVSVSGQEDNRGAIITGTFDIQNGVKTALNSHRIKFSSTFFGWESEVGELIDELQKECYLYLFKNKKAQLDIPFGEDEKTEGKKEPEE